MLAKPAKMTKGARKFRVDPGMQNGLKAFLL